MAEFDQDDRTESPTALRREEFRKQGSVAVSRELVGVAVLLALGLCIPYLLGHMSSQMQLLFQQSWQWNGRFGHPTMNPMQDWTTELVWTQAREWAWIVAKTLGPVAAIVFVIGAAASFAQVGFFLTFEPLAPNFQRLDPIAGFARLFSWSNGLEVLKAAFKIAIVGIVFWTSFARRGTSLGILFEKNTAELSPLLCEWIGAFFLRALLALAAIAGLDYFLQRVKLERQMRMTKREVREEYRLREGDPMLKARIKGTQRKLARKRMMDAVKKADVVVTNPTHISVALVYKVGEMAAPKIVAMGADYLALKIRLVAKAAGVPLVENKPLARAIYRDLDVGQTIPPDLYKAVAQVLGYVYRLKRATARA